jgi:hypothetical protein
MSQSYIKDNVLQPAALMTRELASSVLITIPALKKPGNKGDDESNNQYPYDYYTAAASIQYPDKSMSRTFYLPEVIIYNLPRASGNSMRYPLAFSRGFVAYFEPALKKAYSNATFNDNRYADTPTHVWTELTAYPPDPVKKSPGLIVEVSMVKGGKRSKYEYKGLDDFFGKTPFVAIRADITCTIKMQAAITKGSNLSTSAPAKPVFVPTKVFIRGKADIPQPVGNASQTAVSTEANNADEEFWKMMEELNAGGDDDEDDGKPVSNTNTPATTNGTADDDDDDEFEDES